MRRLFFHPAWQPLGWGLCLWLGVIDLALIAKGV